MHTSASDRLPTLTTRVLERLVPVTRPPERVTIESILILKPCCLGDVILATPVIGAVRRAYPQARIDFATGAWSRPAVANHPQLRRIVDTGRVGQGTYGWGDIRRLAAQLRETRYDLCLTLDRSPRVGTVALLAGIPLRAGLDSAGRGFAHNIRVPVPPIRYEPELYLDVPRAVIPQSARSKYELTPSQFYPSTEDQAAIERVLAEHAGQPVNGLSRGAPEVPSTVSSSPWVAIHPGGGSNPGTLLPSKRWPPERFATIGDRLVEGYAARVILIGAQSDATLTQSVRAAMKHEVLDLTAQLSFGQLGALYQRCALMVGNDSGVMHLANAVGTPVVALFGPSDPRVYGPYDARSLALWHEVGCNPCFQNGHARPDCCPNRAIEAISVEECWEAVEIVLRRQKIGVNL
jgi:ADP-heptose:LPS heptosyltransferase